MDIENKQLRETLEEYKSEFAEVKNQGKDFCNCIHVWYVIIPNHEVKLRSSNWAIGNRIMLRFHDEASEEL